MASAGRSWAKRKDGSTFRSSWPSARWITLKLFTGHSPRHHAAKGTGTRGGGNRIPGTTAHRPGLARQRGPRADRPQYPGRRPGRDAAGRIRTMRAEAGRTVGRGNCGAARRSFGPSCGGCFLLRLIPKGSWPRCPTWPTGSSRRGRRPASLTAPSRFLVSGQPDRDAPVSHRPGSGPQRGQACPAQEHPHFPGVEWPFVSQRARRRHRHAARRPRTPAAWASASCGTVRRSLAPR